MNGIIYAGDSDERQEQYDERNSGGSRRLGARLLRVPHLIATLARFVGVGIERLVNTTDFSARPDYQYKLETVKNWSSAPCGTNYSEHSNYALEHYEDIEKHRYKVQAWLLEAINSFDVAGKKLLEIGYGAGTDHLVLARRGAVMHGIDLTPASYEATSRRFNLYSQTSQLRIGDAERLPYPDKFFDFIYSFGVVHHSPNTEQVINEVHRVLKPGGRCYITVYHKNSIFFWWSLFVVTYLLRGAWRKRSLQQQLSLIEYPNNNEDMVIRLYTKKEFADLFREFSSVKSYIRHLVPCDIELVSKLYRDPYKTTDVLEGLARRFGWYVVIEATK